MEQLRFLEAQDRNKKVLWDQKFWSTRLNELMGGNQRRATPSFPARAPPPVDSPASASTNRSSPKSAAPKWVGKKASEFHQAMSVDRIERFRKESARHEPTTRQVLTIDDSIETAMAIRLQDPNAVRMKVDLFEPLEECGPEAARELVLEQLRKGLHSHVGQCKSYADGRWIEVILPNANWSDEIKEALEGLGDVTRKANLSTEGVMSALMFNVGRMQNRGGYDYYDDEEEEAFSDREYVDEGAYANAQQSRHVTFGSTREARPAGGRRGSMASTTSRRGGRYDEEEEEENSEEEEGSYRKLHRAIDVWDARLRASSTFQEAARRTRRPVEGV